jgi:hypothetical protein
MVAAFEFFDCVPKEVWWDNPKTVATLILQGRERRLGPLSSSMLRIVTPLSKAEDAAGSIGQDWGLRSPRLARSSAPRGADSTFRQADPEISATSLSVAHRLGKPYTGHPKASRRRSSSPRSSNPRSTFSGGRGGSYGPTGSSSVKGGASQSRCISARRCRINLTSHTCTAGPSEV